MLLSCGTLPYQLKNQNFITGNNKGILICSLRMAYYGLGRMPSPSYYFRQVGGEEAIRMAMFGLPVPKKEVEGRKECEVLIFELPAGEYELVNWNLFFNMGIIQYDKSPVQPFSMPFTVAPDAINYLGEFCIEDYIMRVADMGERDLRIANANEPSLSSLPIIKREMHCKSGCSKEVKTSNEFFYLPIIPVAK